MADSPKCLDCLKAGLVGQTYKVAGRGLFKCSDCKRLYHTAEFDPIEFTWKTDPESWKQWVNSQGITLEKAA